MIKKTKLPTPDQQFRRTLGFNSGQSCLAKLQADYFRLRIALDPEAIEYAGRYEHHCYGSKVEG